MLLPNFPNYEFKHKMPPMRDYVSQFDSGVQIIVSPVRILSCEGCNCNRNFNC